MRYEAVELHGAAELAPREDGGVCPQRVPEATRLALGEGARERMLDATGLEVRFVMRGGPVRIHAHSLSPPSQVTVFHGDFLARYQPAGLGGELTALEIQRPDWFLSIDPARLGPQAFSPHVCRVWLNQGRVCLHGVEGDVRPPLPEELPSLRYLAYGTSITQGASSTGRHLCYVMQTARRLGADVINLGVGSAALCEPELADHIALRDDWDLCTLALSTNMSGWPLDRFRERVSYMIDTIAGADPRRLAVAITLWPKTADLGPDHVASSYAAPPEGHRQALREAVRACPHANLRLLEGRELLPCFNGLGLDLLHPSDYGHTLMAENLARELGALWASHRASARAASA